MTTLLFVEDTRELAQLVIQELETNGYQVQHASDGEMALQLFQRSTPGHFGLDAAKA
jgi:DNA-binding response OmpR family regulator